MKVNELRIGNLVKYEGLNCLVLAVASHVVDWDLELGYFPDSIGFQRKIEDVKPIPITEGRLKDFGFEKKPPLFESYPLHPYWVKDGVCLFFNESDSRDIYLLGYAEMRIGKYYATANKWTQSLHVLQNYYFAHTEKELTVNE